jgi:hypothetical protein
MIIVGGTPFRDGVSRGKCNKIYSGDYFVNFSCKEVRKET